MPVPAICLLKSMTYTRCSQAIAWHFAGVYGSIFRPRWRAQRSCRPCRISWRLTPSWSWRCRVRIGKSVLVKRGSTGFLGVGPMGEETLIARPRGLLRMVNVASPAYLARYGVPRSLEDLQRQEHRTIHFSTMLGARPVGWEYPDGDSYATLQLPGALHVNSAQTYEAAALAGLGLIQAPLLGIGGYLESGALVEVLPGFGRRSLAVSLVVAHRRNLSRRVRAFMKWIEDVLTPYLE